MDLIARLRAATRPQHEAIETAVNLVRPDLTADEYADTLAGFYGFLATWEPAAEAAAPELAGFLRQRRKAHMAAEDLRFFGRDPDAVPRCDALPDLSHPARVRGAVYVIEGSTLGGQVVSRHVEATLGLAGGRGTAYFRSYGDRVGASWRGVVALLRDAASPTEDFLTIESGCETFSALHNWLAPGRVTRRGQGSGV